MKRVALYVRVSTDEQKKHGLSVDNQIQALTEYAKQNDYVIAGLYNDAGISAAKAYTKRPALLQLIKDCDEGKIDLVLFTRLDRWFRSVKDYHKVQEHLDAHKVYWKAIWEDYETETSAGRFKVNIMLAIAEAEAARTSEKIKSVMDYKRNLGDYVGKAPAGYIKANSKLLIDEETRAGITAFFETYLKTHNKTKAMAAAHNAGYDMCNSSAKKMLSNPAYCGECRNGYTCEAFITREEFNSIQEARSNYSRQTKHGDVFLFSQLAVCGRCGRRMPARRKYYYLQTGERRYYTIYTCENANDFMHPCVNLCINQDRIEKNLLAQVDALIDEEIASCSVENVEVANVEKQKEKLEGKLNRLADLYADGDIDAASYKQKRDAIKQELNSLNRTQASAPAKLPTGWQEIYAELTKENKRAFWLQVIKEIRITNETKDAPQVIFNFSH